MKTLLEHRVFVPPVPVPAYLPAFDPAATLSLLLVWMFSREDVPTDVLFADDEPLSDCIELLPMAQLPEPEWAVLSATLPTATS
jgi:hypothetical protein